MKKVFGWMWVWVAILLLAGCTRSDGVASEPTLAPKAPTAVATAEPTLEPDAPTAAATAEPTSTERSVVEATTPPTEVADVIHDPTNLALIGSTGRPQFLNAYASW